MDHAAPPASFSAARRRAERARGLAETSASDGSTGLRVRSRKVAARSSARGGAWRDGAGVRPERARTNSLTARSSSEWKDTTARRPPGTSTCSAAARPRSSSPSSSLTAMRSAWKARVAGSLSSLAERADRAAHDLGQFAGGLDALVAAALDDRVGDLAALPLLAVAPEDVGELGLVAAVHQIGCRLRRSSPCACRADPSCGRRSRARRGRTASTKPQDRGPRHRPPTRLRWTTAAPFHRSGPRSGAGAAHSALRAPFRLQWHRDRDRWRSPRTRRDRGSRSCNRRRRTCRRRNGRRRAAAARRRLRSSRRERARSWQRSWLTCREAAHEGGHLLAVGVAAGLPALGISQLELVALADQHHAVVGLEHLGEFGRHGEAAIGLQRNGARARRKIARRIERLVVERDLQRALRAERLMRRRSSMPSKPAREFPFTTPATFGE